MMLRKTAVLVMTALTLGGAACGGRVPELGPNEAAAQPVALDPPVEATPLFALKVDKGPLHPTIRKISRVNGVAAVTALQVRKMVVRSPKGGARLRVATVDPLGFRPLALTPARDASYVWTSLLGGEAVVSYDAAHRLKIADSEPLRIGNRAPIAVGAFADTGVPNVADILVSRQSAATDSLKGSANIVEIGARPGASTERIAHALRALVPGAELHRLIAEPPPILQPSDPQPVGVAQGSIIGTMHYLIQKNGYIKPDPAWVNAYIVRASVPILGIVTCNRLMIPQLHAALDEIARDGLASAIDPGDYGGCYVPRFVDRNPSLPLSMHAFGLAIDLNVSSNELGTKGHMDPRVVVIFEKWGFRWGGTFSTRPDPMHFELARLVAT